MKQFLLIALLFLAVNAGTDECPDFGDYSDEYNGGDCITYGGCEFIAKWWTCDVFPNPSDPWGAWESVDESCEIENHDPFVGEDLTCPDDLIACHAYVCCEREDACCGGTYQAPYCCSGDSICGMHSDGIHTHCNAPGYEECWYGVYAELCEINENYNYALGAGVDDDYCKISCVNGDLLSVHCDPQYGNDYQMCTCGCAAAPTEACSHNMAIETCLAIDVRATDDWCQSNCILGDLVHPACDPFVDDVHTVCLCDCDDGEIIQEESSTTSEYEEETYGTETDEEEEEEEVVSSSTESEDPTVCDHVTFYSECDYTGDVLVVQDDQDCLSWLPKSFCLPANTEITLFDVCQYNGQNAIFAEGISCLDELSPVELLTAGIKVNSKRNNLKKNEKVEKFEQKFRIIKF